MRISVEALIFDLDGTLIDSKRDLYLSVHFLQKKFGAGLSSEEEVSGYIGDGVIKLVQRALPGFRGLRLAQAVSIFKRHYHRHCLDHTRLYPGAAEALAHFRHKKLAVVTNKPARISRRILQCLGVLPFFRTVVGGDSLRYKKPDPHPVQFALHAMRIGSPQEAVMVGDGINDILSGRRAGTRTCGILSNIGDPQKLLKTQPDFKILTMYELMRIFN